MVDLRMLLKRIQNKLHIKYWTMRKKMCRNGKLDHIIIFESEPDLSDNTKAVFDEMLRRGLNKTYKLVWLLYDCENPPKSTIPGIHYLLHWDMKAQYYCKIAKTKICCNRFLEKENPNQVCIYLSHGTCLKDVRHSYRVPEWMDYCIAAAPGLEETHAYTLCFDPKRTVGLGFPRNDSLLRSNVPVQQILNTTCKKVVVWYPTFRQHNCVKYTTIRNPIPLLDDFEAAKKLNSAAVDADVLIVIKPHFAQDTRYIKEMNLSNIRFIDDAFFKEHDVVSYEFVGTCDALITDYSSIYFDYTLCDKPIAAIWSDIEEYKKKPGLVENYEYLSKGMEKVYTLEEFMEFIQRVGDDVDLLQAERREIRDYSNYSTACDNAKRVVDFIIKQTEMKNTK